MLFVDAPVVAAQGAAEAVGGAVTGATLVGVSPAIIAPVPMGGEEVSLLLAQAAAAHAAQFLVATGVGVTQRELFAATVTTSAGAYTAMNALSQASLAV
ncbi:MAG: PE domain-containing protein [Mycobacterium sp.]